MIIEAELECCILVVLHILLYLIVGYCNVNSIHCIYQHTFQLLKKIKQCKLGDFQVSRTYTTSVSGFMCILYHMVFECLHCYNNYTYIITLVHNSELLCFAYYYIACIDSR